MGGYETNTLRMMALNPIVLPAVRRAAKATLRKRLGVKRLHLKKRKK